MVEKQMKGRKDSVLKIQNGQEMAEMERYTRSAVIPSEGKGIRVKTKQRLRREVVSVTMCEESDGCESLGTNALPTIWIRNAVYEHV